MSTGTVSPQFDQFSESSTVVGVDKTREEYLKLFSRASYSPLCDRPYSSPVSGFYDALNTSTRLLLLNYRFKNSHLREQVLPEELASSSRREFEYESIIMREKPKPKPSPPPKRRSSHVAIDPYRHFENTPHPKTKRSASVSNRRSQSVLIRKDQCYNEPQPLTESFCHYQRDNIDKSGPEEPIPIKEVSYQRVKSSNIRRKLPLTKGQQIYLIGKCHIYDIEDAKVRRTNSYAQALNSRYQADNHCKPQFRLSDSGDYFKYSKYLRIPCSLTPNSSPQPTNTKKPLINTDSHQSFLQTPIGHESKQIPIETSSTKTFI